MIANNYEFMQHMLNIGLLNESVGINKQFDEFITGMYELYFYLKILVINALRWFHHTLFWKNLA